MQEARFTINRITSKLLLFSRGQASNYVVFIAFMQVMDLLQGLLGLMVQKTLMHGTRPGVLRNIHITVRMWHVLNMDHFTNFVNISTLVQSRGSNDAQLECGQFPLVFCYFAIGFGHILVLRVPLSTIAPSRPFVLPSAMFLSQWMAQYKTLTPMTNCTGRLSISMNIDQAGSILSIWMIRSTMGDTVS